MSTSRSHTAGQHTGYATPGLEAQAQDGQTGRGRKVNWSDLQRPLLFGFLGTLGLAAIYLGIVTLAESWSHALSLFREDALFVVPIALGFGIQVALFVHLKRVLRPANGTGATGALTGTSGGASTLSMLACCAHHVTDVLPLLGLSGAAVFMAQYKIPFMVVGLLSNAIGIGVLMVTIRKAKRMHSSEGACH